MSKTIGIIIGIIAIIAIILVPAIKGPFNRWRNEANEKLNAEYVVDNYKAEYVKLHDQRAKLLESKTRFEVEKKVAQAKLSYTNEKLNTAKDNLKAVGTSDLKAFAQAKNVYELLKTEVDNYTVMVKTYSQAMKKLDKTLALVDANMAKAKLNVDTLSAKKTLVDTIKSVNKSLENVNGIGDSELAVNVEKLDDDMLHESIKLETLDNNEHMSKPMTEAEAKTYLENLK